MSDALDVTGGAGGVAAHVVDMRGTADRLDASGDQVRDLATQARRLTMDADLVASTVLSPGTAAMAVADLLDVAFGSGGLTASALRLETGANGLRAVAVMFETRDAAIASSIDLRNRTGGYLLGRVLLPVGALAYGSSVLHQASEVKRDLLSFRIRSFDALWDRVGAVPGDAGRNLATGLDLLLVTHPDLVDVIAGGSPELTRGLLDSILPLQLGSALGPALPRTFEEVTASIMDLGSRGFGAFDDSRPITVTPADLTRLELEEIPRLDGVEGILGGQTHLHDLTAGDADPYGSRLRVTRVTGPDGPAYVVQVPGTQAWSPRTGPNPSDLTTNLALEARHDAMLLAAIADALRQAGVSDAPVMITGHSQGGIAAASFAAHPEFSHEFNITHVVTGGSPIGRIPVPADVQLLAVEHLEDPVPRLEGAPNPDRVNATTVLTSVAAHPDVTSAIAAHSSRRYEESGAVIDDSDHPSLVAWRQSAELFFGGDATVQDFIIQREP